MRKEKSQLAWPQSSSNIFWSAGRNFSRTIFRIIALIRARWPALVKPYHAREAYRRRASEVARTTSKRRVPERPWAIRMRIAYSDWLTLIQIRSIWRSKLSLSEMVTPRITDSDTLPIPGIGGERLSNLDRGRINTISLDLLLFNLRLQVSAQLETLYG